MEEPHAEPSRTEHSPSGQPPAIDPRSIDDLRGLPDDDGNDLLARLAGMFREDAPAALIELQGAMQRGDMKATEKIAHTLKGSTAYFGAYPFQELCGKVEMAGRAGDLAPVANLLPAIESEMHRVMAALEAAISGGKPSNL